MNYKKLYLFVVVFLLLSTQLFGNAWTDKFEGNGFSMKTKGETTRSYTFYNAWYQDGKKVPVLTAKGSNFEFPLSAEYVEHALANFKCPEKLLDSVPMEAILENINFETGHYTCGYYNSSTPDGFTEKVTIDYGGKNSPTAVTEAGSFDAIFEESNGRLANKNAGEYDENSEVKVAASAIGAGAFPTFMYYFGNFVFPLSQGSVEKGISFKTLNDEIVKIDEKIRGRESKFVDGDGSSEINHYIDSHSEPDKTISGGLTGLITLDPAMFATSGDGTKKFVTESGQVNLVDYRITSLNGNGDSAPGEGGFVDNQLGKVEKIIGFASSVVSGTTGDLEDRTSLNLFDFIDKHLWGFYVYFLENLRAVLATILIGVVFLAAIYAGGSIGTEKLKFSMLTGDSQMQQKQDNTSIKSRVIDMIAIIFVFSIPVTIDKVTVPVQYLYLESSLASSNKGSTEEIKEKAEFFESATISQNAIRYFANKGNLWANTTSDYLLYAYLRYLESKSAFFATGHTEELNGDLTQLLRGTYTLKKYSDFYNYICLPMFKDSLDVETGLLGKNGKVAAQLGDPASVLLKEHLNFGMVNYNLCRKIESDINSRTSELLGEYSNIKFDADVMLKTLETETSDELFDRQVGFREFSEIMGFMQNKIGWINVASVPISYTFFTTGSSNLILDGIKEEVYDTREGRNTIVGKYRNKKSGDDFVSDNEGLAGSFFSAINGAFVYMILPGFNDAVSTLDGKLNEVFVTKLENGETDSKSFIRSVTKNSFRMVSKAFGVVPIFGTMKKFILKMISKAPEFLIYIILYVISFMIILALYKLMIAIATMVILSTVILIKITLFFIELLIYFLISDAVIFWSIVSERSEYMKTFLGKGLITLLITPTLIVISVYVYIFTINLLTELYNFMIRNTNDMLVMANETIIRQNAKTGFDLTNGYATALAKQFNISIYTAFGGMVVELFGIILSIIVIFKFKDWILRMVGYQDDGVSSSVTDEMQGRLNNYSSPIK